MEFKNFRRAQGYVAELKEIQSDIDNLDRCSSLSIDNDGKKVSVFKDANSDFSPYKNESELFFRLKELAYAILYKRKAETCLALKTLGMTDLPDGIAEWHLSSVIDHKKD